MVFRLTRTLCLVARTLESAWEKSLQALRLLEEEHERFCATQPRLLTAAEQERYSAEARRRDRERLRAAWGPHRDVILDEIDGFLALALPLRLRRSVATLARAARSVDRTFD